MIIDEVKVHGAFHAGVEYKGRRIGNKESVKHIEIATLRSKN